MAKAIHCALLLALCGVALAAGCASPAGNNTKTTPATSVQPPPGPIHFKPCSLPGVELSSPMMASGGYMIDIRCLVVDADKAAPLLDRETKPYLIVEKNGKKLYVPTTPKVGSLRQTATAPIVGREYFMFFGNPGVMVQRGDKITLVIGDYREEHLVLQ
jgi:hypothetical protein